MANPVKSLLTNPIYHISNPTAQVAPTMLQEIAILFLKLYGPFLWIGFNCLEDREPLRRDILL